MSVRPKIHYFFEEYLRSGPNGARHVYSDQYRGEDKSPSWGMLHSLFNFECTVGLRLLHHTL